MARNDLLRDIQVIVEGLGFEEDDSHSPMTYQRNVSYPSLINNKKDKAHFLLHSPNGTLQIVAKWQEVNGTAIEKLGHSVLDAARTEHQKYLVVCGGNKLVRRAIDYLNDHKNVAPKLEAMEVHELEDKIESYLFELS
ncbi:hypothetical protein L4D04_02585 [Photobacterium angustum]|uniref:PD-(D/E)XK nuclease domain-containing protein n=1 Tax=Photobacterium angustum (strain S14 / CCUG 15956) TaxID=314292 RepID=Q1ZP93_PHOAS|nr:PD-(D/E)XK nuclease superfamily protein [Photobacterium angustum]EAS64067.1 hypothetical protein VAS14_17476 [Photobacterium angustum S14]